MTPPPADSASLDGARVWFVSDGSADAGDWTEPFVQALRQVGAASVDVLGVSGALGMTARNVLEQGAERVARTLRLTRRGEPDAAALDALAGARPDLVIADHPGTLRTLEVLRDTLRADAVHLGLAASYGVEETWRGARGDAFVVADRAVLDAVRRPGLSDAALQLAGPPVAAGFDATHDRATRRAALGFDGEARVVMVDVTTLDPTAVDRLVFQLSLHAALTPVFYYGREHEAADVLRQAAAVHGLPARMFGHLDALASYFVAADLVLVGPANPRIAAYLCLDRPTIALDPALASSELARSGAVVVADDVSGIGEVLARVAADGVPQAHVDAARDAVAPHPTAATASAIARIWASRHALRAASLPIQATPREDGAAPGRLESIGGSAGEDLPVQPLSRAAAKEQLAALILDERKVEAELSEQVRLRDRWMGRFELAEQHGEADLVGVAREHVDALGARVRELGERLDAIRAQKDLVRRRAAAASGRKPQAEGAAEAPADVEARFRRLEMESDLDRLRRRAREE